MTFEMRQRLEELNWRTQPRSVNNGDHGEAVEDWDSKPSETDCPIASLVAYGVLPPRDIYPSVDCTISRLPSSGTWSSVGLIFEFFA